MSTIIKKTLNFKTFESVNKTAENLTYEVSLFLREEIESLNVHSHIFKSGLERCFVRVLNSLMKQEQKVMIFPDSIPSFTLMILKKNENNFYENGELNRNSIEELNEFKVLDSVISRFFKKNQQKVLLIENTDLLFALFPLKDTKKYLKEMNLFITFDDVE